MPESEAQPLLEEVELIELRWGPDLPLGLRYWPDPEQLQPYLGNFDGYPPSTPDIDGVPQSWPDGFQRLRCGLRHRLQAVQECSPRALQFESQQWVLPPPPDSGQRGQQPHSEADRDDRG